MHLEPLSLSYQLVEDMRNKHIGIITSYCYVYSLTFDPIEKAQSYPSYQGKTYVLPSLPTSLVCRLCSFLQS